jgi:orotate phosphoribosyltransferase
MRLVYAMLKREELMAMFESAGAIRHGHFELSSGLHSGMYVQCALVLQYPRFAEKLGQNLASLFGDLELDAVVSPAMGGLIIGQEVARALPEGNSYGDGPVGSGVPAIFVERDASGCMTMRRGFSLRDGQHVLVVEDVWTTGGSTREAIRVVEEAGGRVVAAGALIDRSGGTIQLGVRTKALLDLAIPSYPPKDCPLCASGSVAVKPGSRFVRGRADAGGGSANARTTVGR